MSNKQKYRLPGLSEEELDQRVPESGRKFHKQIIADINRSLNQADRKYDGDVIGFFSAYKEIVEVMERQFFDVYVDEEAIQKAKDFAEEILDVLLDEFDEEQRTIVYKRLDEVRAIEK